MRLVMALIGLLTAAACTSGSAVPRFEFAPDMVDSVPYDSFAANPVTRDGKTLMAPARGTIARDATPFRYGDGPTEMERAGKELTNPVPPSPEAMARGAKVFKTFCSPCHGERALGDGLIIPLFTKPPSLVAEHARSLPDGSLFHIISRGQKLMPSMAVQVEQEDRWKAIHFIRSLQAAETGGVR